MALIGGSYGTYPRGGSRTPKTERQSLGGHLHNILNIFSEKPYEIKEILVHGGAHAMCTPPKFATAYPVLGVPAWKKCNTWIKYLGNLLKYQLQYFYV